ncbi:sensor histidine kinase [Bacillus sp. USDA818B3_A]|uniref:sensor histidine kinase n=1 Tax=Bacillus sp. USDA818B3_A TaxID=2698834 RepID=UPI00136D3BCB|nr:HAMP domain-containing sensor histidine kinase [Bacillus sp. USDA818B3_A]
MLYVYISLALVIGYFILTISLYLFKSCGLMKKLKESEKSYRDLAEKYEAINRNLEKKIHEEVEKNRQKDHLLIQHSKLAAMGEMIASIGHQWRQPLNSLSLIIQDVREEFEFGQLDEIYIDQFTKESLIQIKHMSRTINDFRKFYKPNNEKTPFSIGSSIEDALSIFSSSLKYYGINMEFEYRGELMAYGFPNEYSQVVLNILTNARDAFVEKEMENRRIKIQIIETKEYVRAEFTDNAGGIDPLILDKIFDPYFTTRPHGTGLGLYMTKMILENMNGTASVENYEYGARFVLSVPKVKQSIQQEIVSVS